MWRLKKIIDIIFKENIVITSFAVLFGFSIYFFLESLFSEIVLPVISKMVINNHLNDYKIYFEQDPGVEIRYGTFIASLICFVLISFLAFLFYYIFGQHQSKLKKQLEAQIKPTFRDGINLEIRDYLKYLPQIKDVLKNKEQYILFAKIISLFY